MTISEIKMTISKMTISKMEKKCKQLVPIMINYNNLKNLID